MDLSFGLSAIALVLAGFFAYKSFELEKRMRSVEALYRDLHELQRRMDMIKKSAESIIKEYGSLSQLGKEMKELKEELYSSTGKLEKIGADVSSLSSEVKRIEGLLSASLNRIEKLEEIPAKTEALEEELRNVLEKANTNAEGIEGLNSLFVELRESLSRLEAELRNTEGKLEKISFIVGGYQQFKDSLTQRVDTMNEEIKGLSSRISKMEAFLDYMRDVERSIREMKAKFSAFEKSKSLIFDLLTKTREDLRKLEKQMSKVRAPIVYDNIQKIMSELKVVENELHEFGYELSLVRAKVNELSAKYEKLLTPDILEVELYNSQLETLRERLKSLREKVENLGG